MSAETVVTQEVPVSDPTPGVPTGDGQDQAAAGMVQGSEPTATVPERDLDNLRSTYDKREAEIRKQLEAAQEQLRQERLVRAQMEEALFNQLLAALPPEEAEKLKQARQQYETARQLQGYLAQIAAQVQSERQRLEPIARQTVLQRLAEKHGIPVQWLEDIDDPIAAQWVARKAELWKRQQQLQQRRESGADRVESGGQSSPATVDVSKFRGTGDIRGYLKALRQAAR